MTPRQAKLIQASEAVDSAIKEIDKSFPASKLDSPVLTPFQREIVVARRLDIAALDLASKTVMAVAVDPENFGKLMRLRAEKPSDFAALMDIVDRELARPPAEPVSEAA